MKIFGFNLNFVDFISINLPSLSDYTYKFLVDTQADISVLKYNSDLKSIKIDKFNTVSIKGVTDGVTSSLGSIITTININNFESPQEFHIVDKQFPIPVHGILGRDFLKSHQCNIDYDSMTISIPNGYNYISIPILEGPENGLITVPARSEVIRKLFFDINEPHVVLNDEISTNIHVASTIINKNSSYIRILNTSDTTQTFPKNSIKLQPLNDFNIITSQNSNSTELRSNEIRKILEKTHSENINRDLFTLCTEFHDIFHLENDKLTCNNFYKQELNITANESTYIKNYRLPFMQKKEIESQVQQLIKNDLIEPTVSNFNSPLILVPKKSNDGTKKYRLCIDYRSVNRILIPDKHPLPRLEDILDNLGNAKFFSVIDLQSGFHQIPLEEKSRHVTAFSTDMGAFQWKVLPFGLNIAPNSFSRMMSIAFTGLSPSTCFLYMDDIIVVGRSEKHHLTNLRKVFESCRTANLKLNPSKCQFFKHEVTYLGHKCTQNGIIPDNAKLEAIKNYPKPHDANSTKRFVAFANFYRRFIRDFANLTQPLNALSRKNSKFIWTENCDKSFESLKLKLSNPPVLAYPDFTREFIVTVDASKLACGAVLSQLHNDSEHPIYYASKNFTKGEQNKATIEQELIAIHWAVKKFRPYLYGTKFTIRSDHKPLVFLFSLKDPSSRLTRIRLDLEEYNFQIIHIKGKENTVADALSRITIDDIKLLSSDYKPILTITTRSMTKKSSSNSASTNTNIKIDEPRVFEAINNNDYIGIPVLNCNFNDRKDPPVIKFYCHQIDVQKRSLDFEICIVKGKFSAGKFLSVLQSAANNVDFKRIAIYDNNLIFKWFTLNNLKDLGSEILNNLQIIVLKEPTEVTDIKMRSALIKFHHDDPIHGGHVGQKRLYNKLKHAYKWKNMKRDISIFIKNCHKCQVNKSALKTKEKMIITMTPQKSFQKIVIDTIGPLPKSHYGNQYIVTIMCDLSKYLISCAVPSKEAKIIAEALFHNLYLVYGPFMELLSDCGTEYLNKILAELLQLLNIQQTHSTAYHHQTVGTVERNHRVFNEYLRSFVQDVNDWECYLRYFTFCYNTTPHTSFDMRYSPFEIVFGKSCDLPHQLTSAKIDPVYNIDSYANEIKYKMQFTNKRVKELLEKAKHNQKYFYDKTAKPLQLHVNDKVLLIDHTRHKLNSIFKGPYIVLELSDNNNVKILDINSNKIITTHKDNLRKYVN